MLARAIAFSLVLFLAATGSARAVDPPYILVDMASGQVLAERQSGELWYPASLTKLMTVYLLFEALSEGRLQLDSPVSISGNALSVQPSKMDFPVGTQITVENALKILIVKSANDVAVAVAEMMGVRESVFVNQMNRTAAEIGMTSTRFVNPHGLPGNGQYSTARDMALLARTIWLRFPQYRPLFGIAEISYGSSIIPTGNSLLEFYPGTNGMKTGYICAAGFNLAATATRGSQTLIAVVLGASSPLERATFAASLLDAGFASPGPFVGPQLTSFRPASTVSTPVNRRPTYCPTDVATDNGDEQPDPRDLLVAAFGEPPPLPSPTAVFTGGVDPNARLRVNIPLPMPRPALAEDQFVTRPSPVPLPRPRPEAAELRL